MTKAPKPNKTESCEQYTIRAHKALMKDVDDPAERNTMIWSAWQHERGPTEAEQAAAKEFKDTEKFVKVPSVCYFIEHETTNSQGDKVKYSVEDLEEIASTNNHRAAELHAFSAISDNHTSADDQSHKGDPPVLGAVGAYRLGMVGKKDPKFAIFADEHQYAATATELAKKPRRSVELITFHNTGERFIDPVAALGGRAPRLAMPSRYSVESYSATGAPLVSRYQSEDVPMSDRDFAGVEAAVDQYGYLNEGETEEEADAREAKERQSDSDWAAAQKKKSRPTGKMPPSAEKDKFSADDRDAATEKELWEPFKGRAHDGKNTIESDHAYQDKRMKDGPAKLDLSGVNAEIKKRKSGNKFAAEEDEEEETELFCSDEDDDKEVEKFTEPERTGAQFSAEAGGAGPAMLPGGSNTHTKDTDYFEAEENPELDTEIPEQTEDSMENVSDETIAKFVNAVGNMPEFSWVREQMDAENGGAVDPLAPGGMDDVGGDMGGLDVGMDEGMDPMGGEEADIDQNAMMGEASGGSIVTPPAEDATYDDQQEKFSADSGFDSTTQFGETNMTTPTEGVSVARYNALKNSHIQMLGQLGEVAAQMKKNQQEKTDAIRTGRINEVCERYAAVLDQSVEQERLLGEAVSDDQFEAAIGHLESIGHRFEQASVMRNSIPSGHATSTYRGDGTGKVERNAAWFDKSVELQTAAADRGEMLDWNALCEATDAALIK